MTPDEIAQLPSRAWTTRQVPLRDALVAFVPEGEEFPIERIPPSYEQRWYPEPTGGLRLLVPYDGGPFDSSIFHIEEGAWDHITCDLCVVRLAPETLCYVTEDEPYVGLCSDCYKQHVAQ